MCLTFDRMRSSDFRYHLENSSNEIYVWGEMDGDRGIWKGKGKGGMQKDFVRIKYFIFKLSIASFVTIK